MFYVENSHPAQLIKELDVLIDIIKKENPQALTDFMNWFENFLDEQPGKADLVEKIEDVTEVKALRQNWKNMLLSWKQREDKKEAYKQERKMLDECWN